MVAVVAATASIAYAAGGSADAATATQAKGALAAQVAGSGYGPAAVLAGMSEAQRVGQLFMAGVPAAGPVSSAIRTDISTYHTGSVILTGRSSAGVTATRQLTSQLQGLATSAATDGVPLLVATDQEGGYVQVLSGPGFSTIPTGLSQGSESAAQLRHNADIWGGQLAAAGVNLDLAPVLDTVPQSVGTSNLPIGHYYREYGYTPAVVTAAGTAFIEGMHESGVSVTIKHFPGLGRASGNTDTTYGVYDGVTTSNDPYLQPYATAERAVGAGFVMVSEAIYRKIDAAHQAVFSPTVLGGMLRSELGFHGVIMSDSMEAAAVSNLTPAQQAVNFINAGGDLVLATDPTVIPAMYDAVLARAQADSAFATLVNNAALTVLIAKEQTGLIGGTAAAAATAAGQPTIIERASGGSLAAFTQSSGTWTGPVSLGGRTSYQPAAAAVPGTKTVYAAVTGTDGATWLQAYTSSAAPPGWASIGGKATAPPGIAAASGGQLAVAVRGTDHAIWVKTYAPATRWSGWTGLGGEALNTPIGVTFTPSGDLDVFVTGTDDAIYLNTRHAGRWSGWIGLGGVISTSPAAASSASGTSWVVADGGDGSMWQDNYSGGAWSGWQRLPFG